MEELVAPQSSKGQFKGAAPKVPSGEDCLTINVLTAAVTPRKRLSMPVMVFIHGGGYSVGSSQDFPSQGEGFVRTGRVVYVSFNYRLGALGYLDFSRYSTTRRPIEGNLGLRDQVAALTWVRDNIRAFGGNPRNVTVFGESAGGNAVITLMATPSAHGLFARAIAQSAPSNAAYARDLTDGWAAEFVEVLRAATAGDGIATSRCGLWRRLCLLVSECAGRRTPFARRFGARIPVRRRPPRLMRLLGLDATHGIEMFALFDRLDDPYARTMTALGGREPYTNAGKRMRSHWLQFACTGTVGDTWPAYTEHERLTLIIDTVDRVESDPRGDRRAGWQEFLPDL